MIDSSQAGFEESFRFDEKYLSQIPALQVLVNPSYRYLAVTEA